MIRASLPQPHQWIWGQLCLGLKQAKEKDERDADAAFFFFKSWVRDTDERNEMRLLRSTLKYNSYAS